MNSKTRNFLGVMALGGVGVLLVVAVDRQSCSYPSKARSAAGLSSSAADRWFSPGFSRLEEVELYFDVKNLEATMISASIASISKPNSGNEIILERNDLMLLAGALSAVENYGGELALIPEPAGVLMIESKSGGRLFLEYAIHGQLFRLASSAGALKDDGVWAASSGDLISIFDRLNNKYLSPTAAP